MKGYFRKRGKTWSFTLDIGKDSNGRRKQKTKGGYKTKKIAEEACAELISQLRRGEYVEPSKNTLAQYLNEWINSSVKQTLRATTLDTYRIVLEKHIIPELGQIRLSELTPIIIQNFYTKKLGEGFSNDYVRYMHSILRKSLNQAFQWQIISKNPCEHVSPPKPSGKEKPTWDIEEANRFLIHVENEKYYIPYLLAIHTGMRQGEILGLRWKDCDLIRGVIRIQQTLGRTSAGLMFQEPKTKGSKRNITCTNEVVTALKKHRAKQNQQKLLLGITYKDQDLVNCTVEGKPINPRNLIRHFHRMIDTSGGIPKVRFHDLRHTHASIMLQLGEHPKIVSERLGHSRTSITLDIYSHVIPNLQIDAAKKFGDAMKRNGTENSKS
ncbi:Site-specific recombinase XerD [Marininema mesophilum]|uniref:Site-specific recombinase XerD n=1 Tax=Marininema mesophilum TaxID=1048340 RepID=A0A1H3BWV4_9BACL|nr:site-specific integrase [Marininema mesophilum]SDX46235.1 Site-specific recombinase XerD [Marininema mesophilum]